MDERASLSPRVEEASPELEAPHDPPAFDPLAAAIEREVLAAQKLLKDGVLADPERLAKARAHHVRLRELAISAETLRNLETQPHEEVIAAIKLRYGPIIARARQGEGMVRLRLKRMAEREKKGPPKKAGRHPTRRAGE